MTYDGHGRMKTRHYPIEDIGTNTSWNYNNDDSIDQIIDPRGAITDFTYNNLGLATQISYAPPANPPANITIPDTPTVNFTYNNLGQRTQMTDGTGTTDYVYDDLSRLTSESKYFSDLPNAPVTNNEYTIAYTYNLAGGLKSVTDPFNNTVNYTHDKIGRLKTVIGTPTTNNTTGDYADNIKYRAFGAVKQMDYEMPTAEVQIKMEYDDRLRVNSFDSSATSGTSLMEMEADYTYFNDSRTSTKDDLEDDRFDSTNKYDFAGRLVFNQYGMATNHDDEQVRIYEQNINYDSFSMMKGRSGKHWGEQIGFTSNTYINGRKQNATGLTYDASGNIAHSGNTISPHDFSQTDFDVVGRRVKYFSSSKGRMGNLLNMIRENQTERYFDGDGRPVKVKLSSQNYQLNSTPPGMTVVESYQVWSTVLGSAFTSLEDDGDKRGTKVFAGGAVIGSHGKYPEGDVKSSWLTSDPVSGKKKGYSYFSQKNYREEREPLGQEILQYDPTDDDELSTPPPNEILSGWRDMEWQCNGPDSFYGDTFFSLPQHCQQARWNQPREWQESNPSHVAGDAEDDTEEPGTEEPVPQENTPTAKPDTEAGGSDAEAGGSAGDGGIPPASRPTFRPKRTKAEDAAARAAAATLTGLDEGDSDIDNHSSSRGNLDMSVIPNYGEPSLSPPNKIWFMSKEKNVESRLQQLRDIVAYAMSQEDCTKAFKAIGADTVAESAKDSVIITESTLAIPANDKLWAGEYKIASKLRKNLAANPKVGDVTYPGLYGDSGRRFSLITNRAFEQTDDFLEVTVIHTFLHLGGLKAKSNTTWSEWFWGISAHDLRGHGKKYDDVIESCTKGKKSKAGKAEGSG